MKGKTLSVDEMTLYTENPKKFSETLLKLINNFGKVARNKINIPKNVFLNTDNKQLGNKIKKTIPLTTALERIEYFTKILTKEMYVKTTFLKKIKDTLNKRKRKDIPCSGIEVFSE